MMFAESDNCRLTRVDFPVALGPNRKKDFFSNNFFRSMMRSISISQHVLLKVRISSNIAVYFPEVNPQEGCKAKKQD